LIVINDPEKNSILQRKEKNMLKNYFHMNSAQMDPGGHHPGGHVFQ